ncbi:MAG: hypothetical protein V4662_17850 [Verrucomicrobiota bacterium]
MRHYEITVTTKPKGKAHHRHWQSWEVETYGWETSLNIRAVTVLAFAHYFGRHPKNHWAASGSLCMGQAWSAKGMRDSRFEIEVHQSNRMVEAYREARTIIWKAYQPRLAERRAA